MNNAKFCPTACMKCEACREAWAEVTMRDFVWEIEQAYAEYMAKRPDPNSVEFAKVTEIMMVVRAINK